MDKKIRQDRDMIEREIKITLQVIYFHPKLFYIQKIILYYIIISIIKSLHPLSQVSNKKGVVFKILFDNQLSY